jgi:hypothetical protein
MTDDIDRDPTKAYFVVETKRHKPCLIFRGYRYVQDKIQNRTIYWRCEDRARCNGRAHQLVGNGSIPVLTIKHNHQSIVDDSITKDTRAVNGQHRQRRRQNLKTVYYQQKEEGKHHGISFSRVFICSGGDDARRGAVDRRRAVDKGDGTVKEREKRRIKRTKCPSALLAEADGSSKKERSK